MTTPARPARPPRRVTPDYLERAALHYLERFASSAASLRRVLMRRVDRSARAHDTDRTQGAAWVEALIERYQRSGLLDDRAFARAKAASLHRRGTSARGIRERLSAKGLAGDLIDSALGNLAEDAPPGGAERAAAVALARRRRLGPFRAADQRAGHRDKDLAALGRAGFDYATARRVIDAAGPDDLTDLLDSDI